LQGEKNGEDKRYYSSGSEHPQSFGATAATYELDFYKATEQEQVTYFEANDVAAAFQWNFTQSEFQQPWPWEMNVRQYSYHEFVHPFQSLQAGNWVEDEILEKTMKTLLRLEQLEEKFCVLESFVCNWSSRSSYTDGEFIRILHEKELLKKQVVLSLINTDIRGHGGHWILGVIDVSNNRIILFDSSLVLSPTFYQKFFFYQLHIMHVASQLEQTKLDLSKWKLIVSLDSIQQQNAFDCGPLVVANSFAVTKNIQLDRTPNGSALRSWILECVSRFHENNYAVMEESAGKQLDINMDVIEPFAPTELHIEYKFLKGLKLCSSEPEKEAMI
jgi:Ulp1 family protease